MPESIQIGIDHRSGQGEGGEEVQDRVHELLSDVDSSFGRRQRLYYVRITFETGAAQLNDRFIVLSELENGADLRALAPELNRLSAMDSTIDVLLATTIRPGRIADSLSYRFVDDVSVWEIDPETVDIGRHESSARAGQSATDEFAQLQQEYDEDGGASWDDESELADGDDSAVGVDDETDDGAMYDLETDDPRKVQFSNGEIEFDELVASVSDDEPSGSTASMSDGGTDVSGPMPHTEIEPESNSMVSPHRNNSIVGQLVAELEAGQVTHDELAILREQLDELSEERDETRSGAFMEIEARLDSIEQRLDEHGRRLDEHERVHQHIYTSLFVNTPE